MNLQDRKCLFTLHFSKCTVSQIRCLLQHRSQVRLEVLGGLCQRLFCSSLVISVYPDSTHRVKPAPFSRLANLRSRCLGVGVQSLLDCSVARGQRCSLLRVSLARSGQGDTGALSTPPQAPSEPAMALDSNVSSSAFADLVASLSFLVFFVTNLQWLATLCCCGGPTCEETREQGRGVVFRAR